MKKKLLVIICFLGLFFLSFRFFFSTKGVVGHNWDWGFPGSNTFSGRLNMYSIFTWGSNNLGTVFNLTICHLVQTSFFALIAKLFGLQSFLFLLFFSVAFISFIGFKKLLDFLLKKSFLNYIPSFLYAFSPFLFNDIIGGSWVMWVSYAFCPLYFVYLVKYFEKGGKTNLFISLILSISVIISLQHFVLINLLVFSYLTYKYFSSSKAYTIQLGFRRIFFFVFLVMVINLYWIFPFGYTFFDFTRDTVLAERSVNEFAPVINSSQSIWNIFNLSGYFDRNMYLHVMPLVILTLFQLTVFFAWFSILIYFLLEKNKTSKKRGIFWLLTLVILILVVKGGNGPFSSFTLWLYQSISFMRLFRSPQHLMLIPAFITPILLAISFDYFYSNIKYKKSILVTFSLLVLIWINGWWYNGDLGHRTLLEQGRDHVDFFSLPPELIDYYEGSKIDKQDFRAFFLPAAGSPDFLQTEYQSKGQGVQPEYRYLYKSTFTSGSNKFANKVEMSFCKEKDFDYVKYLSLFFVKDIVLRSDIYPHFTESAKCWNDDFVRSRLDSSIFLEKFLTGKYASAYKIRDDYFLPHFYVPQNVIYSNGDMEILPEIISFKNYNIRSGIYLSKIKWSIPSKVDEFLLRMELKNKITDEELGGGLKPEEIVLPYVNQSPGSLVYPLVLEKEKFEKWRPRKDPKILFEKNLLYASKRIAELINFNIKDSEQLNSLLENYKREMESALGKTKEVGKLKEYLEAHRIKVDQSNLDERIKDKVRSVFDDLENKIIELRPKQDFSKLVYKVEIPKAGEYEIYVNETDIRNSILDIGRTETGKDTENEILDTENKVEINGDLVKLEERNFEEGEQELVLPFNGISENLVDENLRIKDYSPNSIYRISFEYQAPRGGSFFVAEGKTGETAETQLSSTGDEFRNFEMFFKSSSEAQEGSVHLSISVAEERNLEVRRVYQPEIMLSLKSGKTYENKIIPKITFVKINPTKYRVKVEGAVDPYTLIFSENFHQGWKLYINELTNSKISELENYGEIVASYFDGEIMEGTHKNIFLDRNIFKTFWKKSISEERHLLVNGYANSWYITPEDSGGEQDYELIIEFAPQRLFYIGLFISGITLISCLIYLLYNSRIGRRNRQ